MTNRLGRRRPQSTSFDDPGDLLVAAMAEFERNVCAWALQVERGWSVQDLQDIAAITFDVLRKILYREVERNGPWGMQLADGSTDPYRFENNQQLGAFLKSTTTNVARNMRRKRVQRLRHEQIMAEPEELLRDLPDDGDDPQSVLDRKDIEQAITEASSELPPDLRDVFAAHLRGLTQEETALTLGISRRHYRTQLQKAQTAVLGTLRKREDFK